MNPFSVAVKQALISTGRDPNPNLDGCPEEAKLAKSDQSRFRKVKTSRNNVSRYESLDTPNTPNTSGSDPRAFSELHPELKPRQAAWQADTPTTDVSTCGYLNGNASLPRTANPGFDCRVDNKNAIWGFCSTAILAVSDCGLVGGCVDAHACDGGCGISGDPNATTVGWFVNLLVAALAILFPSLAPGTGLFDCAYSKRCSAADSTLTARILGLIIVQLLS